MKKSMEPKWKKHKIIFIFSILLIICLILPFIYYFRYYGTIIFWIHNIEEPCENNDCYNYTFDEIYIDEIIPDNKLDNNVSISGGDYWSVELRLFQGKHKFIILRRSFKSTITVIVLGGETTCFELVKYGHQELYPGYTHTHDCPPGK